jgi:hypothetical protein
MARKKRKYTRHKPLRHDTVPLSAVIVGLLPILVMASIVGIYVIYRYTDLFSMTAVPPLPSLPKESPISALPQLSFPSLHVPDISTPDVTISFDEVFRSFGAVGGAVLDFLMTSSEHAVHLAGEAGAWGTDTAQEGTAWIINGLAVLFSTIRQMLTDLQAGASIYLRALGWTIGDFFRYLDLSGRFQVFLNTVLWPLHFLDPHPLVQAGNYKVHEADQAISSLLKPFGPIFDYILKSFRETAEGIWKSLVDMWNFLNWLTENSK